MLTILLSTALVTASSPTKRLDNLIELLDRLNRESKHNHNENSLGGSDEEEEAAKWMAKTNEEYRAWSRKSGIAGWNYATNLTDENSDKTAEISNQVSDWLREATAEAKKLVEKSSPKWDKSLLRQLHVMAYVQGSTAKSSETEKKIIDLSNDLEGLYGNAVVTKDGKEYHMEPEFVDIMSNSRDWDELQWAWVSWRDATGPHMKEKFEEIVELMNEAARDNGFDDTGSSWRYSNYEMDKELITMVDELYEEIKPLYAQLHAYVRKKLIGAYPDHNIDPEGPIPAHILGNMWAQQWNSIIDLVAPYPEVASYAITEALKDKGYNPVKLFQLSESFFTSLGMDNMTKTFWDKSMLVKPNDGRSVECHGSAWDLASTDCSDFRIKMCTSVTQDYLQTVHHEMGHIQYYMQYCKQPFVFRNGANAAFHEAVGDTIALSVMTPKHLKAIDLIEEDEEEDEELAKKRELNYLMQAALEKVAFLPFGYMIDKWRWEVFNGDIPPDEYNSKWWEYRTKYQGVKPPVERSEADFDPGSKYHVPANVPYIRYFLSFIGQFQFHKALCNAAGHTGPLNACDIYKSKEAGELLMSVLSKGNSDHWQDTMELMTGGQDFKADAIKEYFAPLTEWLQKENENSPVGW